jgi:hypothetical protein
MCSGTENLIKNIEQIFEDSGVDNLNYRKWTNTDRSTLETTAKYFSDFLESLALFHSKTEIMFL